MPSGVRILANAHAGLTALTECKSLILFSAKKGKKRRKHDREHPGDFFFPPPTTCWESKMRRAADAPRSLLRRYSCPPPRASY